MGLIEEVTKMQQQGMSSQQIYSNLQQQGLDKKKISEILSQTAIKNAVSPSQAEAPTTIDEYSQDSGMQQSVMSNNYVVESEQTPAPAQTTNYADYSPESNSGQQYSQEQPLQNQYQTYDSSYQSADNVSEIAEQIFDEKISSLSKKIEYLMDIKTDLEAKTEVLDQRLQKIEKIIDRLQLSILQKVGEYMTNVEDIKKEMNETQKSFKYLMKDKV